MGTPLDHLGGLHPATAVNGQTKLYKPTVSADTNVWGALLNNNWTILDQVFKDDGTGNGVGLKIDTGQTLDATAGTTKVNTPSGATDAASKGYVDTAASQATTAAQGVGTGDDVVFASVGEASQGTGKFTSLESTGLQSVGSLSVAGDATLGTAVTDAVTLNAKTKGDTGTGAGSMYAGITGEIKMFGGDSEPEGWVFCDGSQYLRAGADYADLYTAIGVKYTSSTSGDGNYSDGANFRVPDLRGRVAIGADSAGATITGTGLGSLAGNRLEDENSDRLTSRVLGYVGAFEDTKLTGLQSGVHAHDHDATQAAHTHIYERPQLGRGGTVTPDSWPTNNLGYYTTASATPVITVANADAADATNAHTNMQPFLVINYIIKL